MKLNAKKILAALMVGAVTVAYSPVVFDNTASVAYAAKGGAKVKSKAAPKAAPKPKADEKKADSPNKKDYAPSKSAKDLEKNAPASNAKSAANANKNTQNSGTRWGNALRNIGLFAGGMMLGHLLSNALGLGGLGGMLGDVMGLVMNMVMLGLVFFALRWLWNRFRGNKNQQVNQYQSSIHGTQKQEKLQIRDIQPPTGNQSDYEAKSVADRYRNR